jgi:peptidoglycan/LPS O-acetylase OafA/YrhL
MDGSTFMGEACGEREPAAVLPDGVPGHREIEYRPDVDGLRAIAVLAVIGFHAFPDLMPGGFIGVDVFFVISGFLISSIILKANAQKRFNFTEFYARRILRLFPALIVVLSVSLTFGWFVLDPIKYEQLGEEAAAGALFVANILFWRQSGYFDTTNVKPLLHLWSLGVEEQFYLVWPVTLYVCYCIRRNPLVVIGVIAAISFALNVHDTQIDPSDAFYLPHARFWELMLGAILAYLNLRGLKPVQDFFKNRFPEFSGRGLGIAGVQSFAGIGLVVAALYLIHADSKFPGWWGLVPTLGAFLLITAGPRAWFNRCVLAHRIPVYIGLISYPLYLWHFPLLYFLRTTLFEDLDHPPATYVAGAVAVSVMLAILTFALVELPLRRSKTNLTSLRASSLSAAVAMFVIAAAAATVDVSDGMPKRKPLIFSQLPSAQAEIEAQLIRVRDLHYNYSFAKLYGEKPCFRFKESQTVTMFIENKCVEKQYANEPTVFLIGDSHSASLSLGLRPFLADRDLNFLNVSTGWCEPITNEETNATCGAINAMILSKIAEYQPEILIIDSYWSIAAGPPFFKGGGDYMGAVHDFLLRARKIGAQNILVVGEIPTWSPSLPDVLITRYLRSGLPIPDRSPDMNKSQLEAIMRSAAYPDGVTYASLRDFLCNDDGCMTRVGPNLEADILLWDYGHLTIAGSDFVTKTFIGPLLSRLLARLTMSAPDWSEKLHGN